MTNVRHSQSRTVQVKQYEPRTFTFEIEGDSEPDAVPAAMDAMKALIDSKLDAAVAKLQEDLKTEKANS